MGKVKPVNGFTMKGMEAWNVMGGSADCTTSNAATCGWSVLVLNEGEQFGAGTVTQGTTAANYDGKVCGTWTDYDQKYHDMAVPYELHCAAVLTGRYVVWLRH